MKDVYLILKNNEDFKKLVEELGDDQPLWATEDDVLGENSPYNSDPRYTKNEPIALFINERGPVRVYWSKESELPMFPESKEITRKKWKEIATK
jgi:hypothetical protein